MGRELEVELGLGLGPGLAQQCPGSCLEASILFAMAKGSGRKERERDRQRGRAGARGSAGRHSNPICLAASALGPGRDSSCAQLGHARGLPFPLVPPSPPSVACRLGGGLQLGL